MKFIILILTIAVVAVSADDNDSHEHEEFHPCGNNIFGCPGNQIRINAATCGCPAFAMASTLTDKFGIDVPSCICAAKHQAACSAGFAAVYAQACVCKCQMNPLACVVNGKTLNPVTCVCA